MRIAEIFHSIQGEGSLVGVPSVFIRTSGCNLRCSWCDTPYASWQPEGDEVDNENIVARVKALGARHVVVTGGEPMIASGIRDLLAQLKTEGVHITIETAGTVEPSGAICDLASISPKLSNSIPDVFRAGQGWVERHERTRLQPNVLRQWCEFYPFQLKFVIASDRDLLEMKSLLDEIGIPIPPDQILLMPEGTSPEVIHSRNFLLVEACKTHGYRYSPRLHIDLFGNQRGT